MEQPSLRPYSSTGRVMPDWSQVSARSFPYKLRQDPGAHNALGRIDRQGRMPVQRLRRARAIAAPTANDKCSHGRNSRRSHSSWRRA